MTLWIMGIRGGGAVPKEGYVYYNWTIYIKQLLQSKKYNNNMAGSKDTRGRHFQFPVALGQVNLFYRAGPRGKGGKYNDGQKYRQIAPFCNLVPRAMPVRGLGWHRNSGYEIGRFVVIIFDNAIKYNGENLVLHTR